MMKLTARKILLNTASGDDSPFSVPATSVLDDGTIFIAVHLYSPVAIRCWHLTNALNMIETFDIPMDYNTNPPYYEMIKPISCYAASVSGNKVVLIAGVTIGSWSGAPYFSINNSWNIDFSGSDHVLGPQQNISSDNSNFHSYVTPGFTHHLYYEPLDRLFVIVDAYDPILNPYRMPRLQLFEGSTAKCLGSDAVYIPTDQELGINTSGYGRNYINSFGIHIRSTNPLVVEVTYELGYHTN